MQQQKMGLGESFLFLAIGAAILSFGKGKSPLAARSTASPLQEPDIAPPTKDPTVELPTGYGLIYTLKRLKDEIVKDRVMSVAGGVTFFSLLAIFPAITALITIFGLVVEPQQIVDMVTKLSSVLPAGGADIIAEQAASIASSTEASLSLALIIAAALALWSANGGTKSLLESLNIAYGVREGRSFIRLTLISLGMTLAAIVLGVTLGAVVAVLPIVLDYLYLGGMTEPLLLWGRWPLIFLVLVLILAVLYRWGPDRPDAEWRWVTPGAILAAFGVSVFSVAFSWYVQNFGSYNETYGSLGAVVALMTWLWLSTAIVMIGAELNSELDRQELARNGKP